jgi:ribonuclease J
MAANARIARENSVPAVLTGENGDLFYLAPTPGVRRRYANVGRLEYLERERKLAAV